MTFPSLDYMESVYYWNLFLKTNSCKIIVQSLKMSFSVALKGFSQIILERQESQ